MNRYRKNILFFHMDRANQWWIENWFEWQNRGFRCIAVNSCNSTEGDDKIFRIMEHIIFQIWDVIIMHQPLAIENWVLLSNCYCSTIIINVLLFAVSLLRFVYRSCCFNILNLFSNVIGPICTSICMYRARVTGTVKYMISFSQ